MLISNLSVGCEDRRTKLVVVADRLVVVPSKGAVALPARCSQDGAEWDLGEHLAGTRRPCGVRCEDGHVDASLYEDRLCPSPDGVAAYCLVWLLPANEKPGLCAMNWFCSLNVFPQISPAQTDLSGGKAPNTSSV